MNRILFPRAFAFAVDDLGWNEGSDMSRLAFPGPHRAGVKRIFDLKDYQYLVEVGKAVGARVQCLFILSEMDRENILAQFPTTTYLRDQWNNKHRVNDGQKQVMNYVCEQSAYMEFGLHGTGHEYWAPNEPQKRAEWYNLTDKRPWPEQSIREHIQCFKDIMAQYGFSKANGHSFPESFVPCAYSYYWNPTGDYSLGKLLSEVGVKYANTDFSQIPELNPPKEINGGDFDYNTHVINRINYGNVWYELNSLPRTPLEQQETDVIESHWPNWLAQDNFLQPEVTAKWISYYKSAQRLPDRYIAKNTEQLHSQWLYNKFAKVSELKPGIVEIDNSRMPEKAYSTQVLGNMVLKIKLLPGQHVSLARINNEIVPAYFEDEGYAFLYLPVLERKKYTLEYKVGNEKMPLHVFNDATYNVYKITEQKNTVLIDVKVYGSQTIRVRCKQPSAVVSSGGQIKIDGFHFSDELSINVTSRDMQGSKDTIVITF
jgi:hypothetical protein